MAGPPPQLFQGDFENPESCFVVICGFVCALTVGFIVQALWGIGLVSIGAGLVSLFGGFRLGSWLARYLPDPYPEDDEDKP